MEAEKIRFSLDTLFAHEEQQVPVESAIPLPPGRTVGNVLSCAPVLEIREARVKEGAVTLTGRLAVHLVLETGERVLYAFDAAAEFSHSMEVTGARESMEPRVFAQLLKCVCHREEDGLRLSALVDLHLWLLCQQEWEAVSAIRGAVGLESLQGTMPTRRRSLLGARAVQIQEETGVPQGTQILESRGTVRVDSWSQAPEGVTVNGTLLSTLLLLTPQGQLEQQQLTTPFTQAVKLEGVKGEGLYVTGELTGYTARVDGEALLLRGDVSLSVYGVNTGSLNLLLDAYDREGSFSCRRCQGEGLLFAGNVSGERTGEGTLSVPNHLPEAEQVLYSLALPALLTWQKGPGGFEVEGVAFVTTVYRCESGLLHSFTGEVPLAFTLPGEGDLLLPGLCLGQSTVTGRGRTLMGRVTVTLQAEAYEHLSLTFTDDLLPGTPVPHSPGILLYAPDKGQTPFDLGKRFGVLQSRLRELNADLPSAFNGTERVIIIE